MMKKTRFKKLLPVIALSALLLPAGCGGLKKAENAAALRCPQTGLMRHADLAVFKDAAGQETGFAALQDFRGGCEFARKGDAAVDVSVDLTFYAENRQKDTPLSRLDLAYFVAILGPDESLLAKEVFPLSVALDGESGTGLAVENVQQHIPLAENGLAGRYKIIFGLQLTPEQLAENRNGPQTAAP